MDHARIAELLEPFLGPPGDRRLSTGDLDRISRYIDLLLRWNARMNLTAIRDPEEIVTRHFGESFFLARHLFPDPARMERTLLSAPALSQPSAQSGISTTSSREDDSNPAARSSKLVIDIGSGAGFPALPVKIWAPEIHLTMIESNHKKAAFLREAARALTLTNVNVITERAESIAARLSKPNGPGASTHPPHSQFPPPDAVTFRAVEKFDQILPVAVSLLAPDATMAILITESQRTHLQTIQSMKWNIISVPESHTRELALGTHA